jgi:DNA-binding transcriptional MerR regulator
MITENGKYYTIEELSDTSGLAASTLYNWTTAKLIPAPIRGLIPGNPSRGLYRLECLDRIRLVMRYKTDGKSMKEIVALMVPTLSP